VATKAPNTDLLTFGSAMIRILVVAASAVVRAGLEALVRESAMLELAGSSPSLSAVFREIRRLDADVVLMELDSFDPESVALMDGVSNQLGGSTTLPVVLLAQESSVPSTEAFRMGVRALLTRAASTAEITAALVAASAGLVVTHPDAFESTSPQGALSPREHPASPQYELTPREIEVLRMMSEGLGNKMIADRLKISEHTVKFHISSIFTKMDVLSRTEAVMAGLRQGIILL